MADDVKVKEGKGKRSKHTCCAPGCNSGKAKCQEKVTFHRLKDIWVSKVPLENWTPPSDARICSKHFTPSSYKTERVDSKNQWRLKKTGTDLLKTSLKPDAVPSIWPNCPEHLTKLPPNPRNSKNSTGLRTTLVENEVLPEERVPEEVPIGPIEVVNLSTIFDFDDNLDTQKLPPTVTYICKGNKRIFLNIDYDNDQPVIKYSVSLDEELRITVAVDGMSVVKRS